MLKKRLLVLLLGGFVVFMSSQSDSFSAASVETQAKDSIVGDWNGKIEIGAGMSLPTVFHFQLAELNAYKGTMESPAQSSKQIEFDEVLLSNDGQITAKIAKLSAEFKGKLNKQTGTIEGAWTQGGATFPLEIRRGAYVSPLRPQEPKPPFPYKSQNVSFQNGEITLSGTLTIPEKNDQSKLFPCAILVHGSGPHDRDETIFNHKPFLVLADYLTRRGLAVLRYDKRGCGKSTGVYKVATSADFASDGYAAINYLKSCPEIDSQRIGMIGHSEGGVVCPMIAADHPGDVSFLVLMAGSALNGEKILLSQIRDIGAGVSTPESTKKDLELASRTYAIIKAEPDNVKALQKVMQMRKDLGIDKEIADLDERTERDNNIKAGLDVLTGPWYRFFLSYEPDGALKKVHCPVLAINGDKDMQVSADENLPVIETALKAGGNKNVRVEKLPNINHIMQTSTTGQPNEYASIEETIAPAVLQLLHDWIQQQSK